MLLDCLTRDMAYDWGGKNDTPDGPFYYHDNNCNILGVAHLDYVMRNKPSMSGNLVVCPQLDDRLGVWMLLDLLPRLGVKLDVLLTTGEEMGRSTASYFEPGKKYNWVVEFDRAGEDVVFYQYGKWAKTWKGWDKGHGSFSDISCLDHLGVMCANMGIGYYNQHSHACYADLSATTQRAKKFCDFYGKHRNTRFPFDPADRYSRNKRKRRGEVKWWNDPTDEMVKKLKRKNRDARPSWNDLAYDTYPETYNDPWEGADLLSDDQLFWEMFENPSSPYYGMENHATEEDVEYYTALLQRQADDAYYTSKHDRARKYVRLDDYDFNEQTTARF